jgi:hypothetical protein
MKNFIHFCDFLGYQPQLTVNGRRRFRTLTTGLLSILITICTILCIIYFGKDLINKKEPIVLTTSVQNSDFGPVNISNSDFNFIFAMESNSHKYYIDSSVFNVNATYTIKKNIIVNGSVSEYLETRDVEIDICSKYYKDEDVIEKNIKFPLNLFYCLRNNLLLD